MHQTKEPDKNPPKQLNGEERGNLPEKEFRVMIVRMIQDLRKRHILRSYKKFLTKS